MVLNSSQLQGLTTSHGFRQVASQISRVVPERYEGENTNRLKELVGNDPLKSKKEEVQLFVYQVTNNLIQDEDDEYIDDGCEHGKMMAIFRSIDIPLSIWKDLFRQCCADRSTGMAFIDKLFEAAVNTESLDICSALLETGADPDRPILTGSCDLQRPVQLAMEYWVRNVEMLKLLIGFGADVNLVTDADPVPALHKAAKECTLEAVQALVKAGADLRTFIKAPTTPLSSAAEAEWRFSDMSAVELAELREPGEERRGVGTLTYLLQFFDKERDHELIQGALNVAISRGRADLINLLLGAGGKLDEFSPSGYTLLTISIMTSYRGSRVSVASALLRHGTDVRTAFDPELHNPLRLIHVAAAKGDEQMVQLLIQHGADVNEQVHIQDGDQISFFHETYGHCTSAALFDEVRHCRTPLHFALYRCTFKPGLKTSAAAISLLRAGAEVVGDELPMAATLGDASLIYMLLDKGAHINQLDWAGRSALQMSLLHGHVNLVTQLLNAGAEVRGGELRKALKAGHQEAVHALFDHGATLESSGNDNAASVLEEAAVGNNFELMLWLLDSQSLPYDSGALVALLASAIPSSVETEKYLVRLLEKRPKTNRNDVFEGAAIACAVQNDQSWAMSHLLDMPPPETCVLPLMGDLGYWHLCCDRTLRMPYTRQFWRKPGTIRCSIFVPLILKSRWDLVNLFLGHGLQPDRLSVLVAIGRCTVSEFVILTKDLTAEDLSQPARSCLEAPLQAAVRKESRGLVQHLLNLGVDVNTPAPEMLQIDPESYNLILPRTALQAAVEHGDEFMIDLLVKAGADVNAPPGEDSGVTALQIAAGKGQLGLARRLLAFGADINAPGAEFEGRTALEAAAEHGRLDMVHFLLEVGASITGESFDSAIAFAEKNGHAAVVRLLEDWTE